MDSYSFIKVALLESLGTWWKTFWWQHPKPQDFSWKTVIKGSHSRMEKHCQD